MAPIFLSSDLFLFNSDFYKVLCLENLGIAIIVILNPLQQRESFLTGRTALALLKEPLSAADLTLL